MPPCSYYAAPLTIVGLSAALAFKARFWNIGIEGQVILGAIGATLVANYDIGPRPHALLRHGAVRGGIAACSGLLCRSS